ncbi:20018_t:CDS:2 [Entrophospora sp. SA101]|nr:20018_t:CDS:2 [Entrophospora sp. SA101]
MPFSFPHLFAEINQKYFESGDEKIELVASPDDLSLAIASLSYLEIEELEKIFYSLYNKLFYFFNYLDYQPLDVIISQWQLTEKITLRRNVLQLPSVDKKEPTSVRSDILILKKALNDLGVHTRFSALDGINDPAEYIKAAQEKGYSALGITDHYNVQAFPEFWQFRSPNLQLIYGCEMEMLEDKLPPYIFNHSPQSRKFLEQDIENLTYCIFDLETTGFFSEYNEIIEIERKSYSLQKLSRATGKGKIQQAHRALEDSKLLTDLFTKLLKSLQEQGIKHLYQLITLSHTDNLFRMPCVFRSDLEKYRQNLLVGAAGNREGEIFSLFSAFNSASDRQKALKFYDYIEANSPSSFRHLWLNGRMGEAELKQMTANIIQIAKSLNVPTIANHNVHYCQPEQKIIKQIIVANEGMNGARHSLYNEATLDGKEDRFANLPDQHLRTNEEIIQDWEFLQDVDLMEEIIFTNPQKIVDQTAEVIIFDGQIRYPDFSENEEKLVQPYQTEQTVFSCYDINEFPSCPQCKNQLNLEGEKTPDIDLNFSGEYQKTAHDYVRELLGEEHVYRIGTINKLSQQTAEIFLREYKKLKKELNPKFNSYNNGNDEILLEQLKGIKRTTGQHPGGLLIIPQNIDIHTNIFLKLDILGHDEPTVLQKLYELTKVNPANISFHDEKIMAIFTQADTLGIPEFGTDFQGHYKEGMKLEELIACREDIWTFLAAWGVDNKTAFLASEYIRKGKWESLKAEIKKAIREKLGLSDKAIISIIKNLTNKQNALIDKISQELAKLEESNLINLLQKLGESLGELTETKPDK